MTRSPSNPLRALSRTVRLLLALVALAAVVAPAASAHGQAPALRSSEKVELNIYDAYLSVACGVEVVATLSGTERRTIYRGRTATSPAHELTTFDGRITWQVAGHRQDVHATAWRACCTSPTRRASSSSSRPASRSTGQHGGTFPIGGGPAGTGVLVYDATVYAEADGFPYWFVNGDPTFQRGTFDATAKRICARLR